MWGWNESGQLALPSKALAEERAQDEDTGAGEGAAGWVGAAGGAGALRHRRQRPWLGAGLVLFEPGRARSLPGAEGRLFPGDTELTSRQEQLAAEDAAFISIQAFPALLDLPQDLEVRKVSCGSRHTAIITRECPALTGGAAGSTPAFGAAREWGGLTGTRLGRGRQPLG